MAGDVAVPEPDELLSDIQALDAWRLHIETRSKTTINNRKSGVSAAPLPSLVATAGAKTEG
ncbi:hypothetical protein D3C86_1987280 [compost metagenome]